MSVSVNVITNAKQNVLMVPNSAVKTKDGTYYVLVLGSPTPTEKVVEIGLSDDTNTEITNGLAEGDQVVTRTISGTTSTSKTSSTTNSTTRSLFGAGGGGGGIRPGN